MERERERERDVWGSLCRILKLSVMLDYRRVTQVQGEGGRGGGGQIRT